MGEHAYFSRSSSQDEAFNGGPVHAPASTAPWPLFDDPLSYEVAHAPSALGTASGSNHLKAQDTLDNANQIAEARPIPTKRRPSVLRLFTGLSRLRRTDTGDTSGSSGDGSELTSLAVLKAHDEDGFGEEVLQEPSDEAVEAYVRKNARK